MPGIALIPYRTRVVIRKVIVDNSGYDREQIQLPPPVRTKYDLLHPAMYQVDGDEVAPLDAGIRYRFNLLELTQADTQNIDPGHIPQPIIRRCEAPSFVLPPNYVIRYDFFTMVLLFP